MYKLQVFIITISLLFGHRSYAQTTIVEDPNAVLREVGNFSSINISSGIDLYLSQGDENGVAVSAYDNNATDRIKTSVENGVLKIRFQADGWRYRQGNNKMVAYVSFRSLREITASGASDVFVNGSINSEDISISLSGASDFKGRVVANKLVVVQSGASDASITGKASVFEIEASGASNFKGYDFETEHCSAKASGASDIKITVNKELYAVASGASSINYKGSGVAREIRVNGASNINKKR